MNTCHTNTNKPSRGFHHCCAFNSVYADTVKVRIWSLYPFVKDELCQNVDVKNKNQKAEKYRSICKNVTEKLQITYINIYI